MRYKWHIKYALNQGDCSITSCRSSCIFRKRFTNCSTTITFLECHQYPVCHFYWIGFLAVCCLICLLSLCWLQFLCLCSLTFHFHLWFVNSACLFPNRILDLIHYFDRIPNLPNLPVFFMPYPEFFLLSCTLNVPDNFYL